MVFGDDVVIFSDKYVNYSRTIETEIAWARWFRKAVLNSANQIYGAESWILKYPNRVYLDSHCQQPIPISIPLPGRIRVHRVAVALGAYEACRAYFGGVSLGSLIVHSGIEAHEHYARPFRIGHVNRAKGFVHVFEDFTLNAVLRELDTVSDFVAYLSKREQLLSKKRPVVVAAGDEQLLAIYLTHLNPEREHDFVLPDEGQDAVYLDESFWIGMVQNPQYVAKKHEEAPSYAWDRLIEHFIKHRGAYDETGQRRREPSDLEWGLRLMAAEPRIRRRQLAYALVHLLENTPVGKPATRLVYSNDFAEKVYVFIVLPQLESQDCDEYRKHRKVLLLAYCKVAKLVCPGANYVIGIATGNLGMKGISEDLVALDVREWTSEMKEEAEWIQKTASLLLGENITRTEGRTLEWPDVANR